MPAVRPTIGVLALQGCVQPHRAHVEASGASFLEVRRPEELLRVDGLILPGGESTTMLRLLGVYEMENVLLEAAGRMPFWGICAGAILMARAVRSPAQKSFNLLDVEVERNAYGRQLESFNTAIEGYPVSFIRAPRIIGYGAQVRVRSFEGSDPVWVEQGNRMVTTFHPELSTETPSIMHQAFFELVVRDKLKSRRPTAERRTEQTQHSSGHSPALAAG